MNNILDNDIKSISIDSVKFKNIFNKYTNINLNIFHENYKKNPLFKKFISLAIKLNCKLFKLENEKYIISSHKELLQFADKIKKILLKKYAINILKNLIDNNNDIILKLDDDLNKLKKYFIYIEMFVYLLNNVFTSDNSIKLLCINPNNINIDNQTMSSGKLECISTTTSNIDLSIEGNIRLSPYINITPSNNLSKGKIINISLKNYIAEYSN
jgi:hypothetical protein